MRSSLEQDRSAAGVIAAPPFDGSALAFFAKLHQDGGGDLSRLEVTAGMNRPGVGLQTAEITELVDAAMDADADRQLSTEELPTFLGKGDELAAAKEQAK